MIYFVNFYDKFFPLWYDRKPKLNSVVIANTIDDIFRNNNRLLEVRDIYNVINENNNKLNNASDILKNMGIKNYYSDGEYDTIAKLKHILSTYIEKNEKAIEFSDAMKTLYIISDDEGSQVAGEEIAERYLNYLLGIESEPPKNLIKRVNNVFSLRIDGEIHNYRIACGENTPYDKEFYETMLKCFERREMFK